jgi:rubredoxin
VKRGAAISLLFNIKNVGMANSETVIINFPGGIISPGHLHEVMEVAVKAMVSHVRFGNRQQMFLDIPTKCFQSFQHDCFEKEIVFTTAEDVAPNIVSSYPAEGIFIADSWLDQGVYKDVFDMFDYPPSLKINICDSDQTFVPFFTGNINWIASKHQHFWHLYIRFPKSNQLYCCPDLIYTNDIVYVSKAIEEILKEHPLMFYTDGNTLYQRVKSTIHPICKPVEQPLRLSEFHLPYYEGFNKHGNNYWLGIYRRNELFPVAFLKDLARVCLETKVGELYSTPWKSLIVKGITTAHRNVWDQLLGKYRINVRHAANELNWQVEDNNEDGLILKRHVIRYFDKEDVRTYGLCFAVKTKSSSGIFGSVIIRKQSKDNSNRLKSLERYEILYTPGFNPNSPDYILFRNNVEKEHLGVYLVSLCKMFYESKSVDILAEVIKPIAAPIKQQAVHQLLHQCKHCLSIYDEATGDPEANIAAGTTFDELPVDYACPLCEAPKSNYEVVFEGSVVVSGK